MNMKRLAILLAVLLSTVDNGDRWTFTYALDDGSEETLSFDKVVNIPNPEVVGGFDVQNISQEEAAAITAREVKDK